MLGLKNAVYVEVFGNTMGQRLMRLNNVEWRRGEPLRMQVIFARMSLDEIVKYITVELKLNAKNEAHVQDRQGHGHRGHREDCHQREIKGDTVGAAEEGSGSGQDLWTVEANEWPRGETTLCINGGTLVCFHKKTELRHHRFGI